MTRLVSPSALRSALRLPFGRRRREPKVYGRIGPLEVRLAGSKTDVRKSQRLRYQVFYGEMAAKASAVNWAAKRDKDPYDAICDHLLVYDTAPAAEGNGAAAVPAAAKEQVVGTYRVLRQDMIPAHQDFYTQSEYDIAPLVAAKTPRYRFMELGRSCVLKPYRNKRTVELLWQGLWSYVREHDIDVMIGCASFMGTDPAEHAMALSFLYHEALATPDWYVRAHDHMFVDMNVMPREQVDAKAALRALPPLIKGYLRLGAMVGDGAVIDRQFGTTDVLIILPVERIDPRYFEHFGAPNERQARVAAGLSVT
ncbi:MAG: GNAT family N-acetyltransferase [Hyphomicrobiaceae bacterium]|nr:GNAT family N-acetyltransferase [Hyphomicrobiaceae bacterium]